MSDVGTDSTHRAGRLTVRAAIAPLVGEPRISAPLTSQLLAGEVLTVLEQRGDWVHVRGEDDYEGWTHGGYLMPSSGSEVAWRLSLGCVVRLQIGSPCALPLGARIAPTAEVVSGETIDAAARESRFPRDASDIAISASTLFSGASYLWGGTTPWGCDCSGFVQTVFGLHGARLPRDAWQQASCGRDMAPEAGTMSSSIAAEPHAPGDLLFFTDRDDRRVTHVGIALGDARMVHSSLTRGGIAIERMNGDDAYVAKLKAGCTGIRRVV
jgi:gamma-D-glutamyl-L-lysine dipeptidyl-peptidase